MSREQMIDRAETVVKDSARRIQNGWTQRAVAAVIVDALLPQVTTVGELKALPPKTLLYGVPSGQAEPVLWQPSWQDPQEILETFGPLTVVWQP